VTRIRYVLDEARIQRLVTQMFGQGSGLSYRPWVEVRGKSPRGRSREGLQSERAYYPTAGGEWTCFLKVEADPTSLEIREQFPMDRLQTYGVARALGVRHPRKGGGEP
jgi:hypothetical protein